MRKNYPSKPYNLEKRREKAHTAIGRKVVEAKLKGLDHIEAWEDETELKVSMRMTL